jgi:glycolate oxidase
LTIWDFWYTLTWKVEISWRWRPSLEENLMDKGSFMAALERIFPAERLLVKQAQLAPYESDALTSHQVRPLAVVIPETQSEVIETVRLCHQYNIPFVARGSGTSLSGASLPIPGGIVIALNRLDRIISLDPEQRLAVVEPGVINLNVTKAAAPHGLYFAPDPSSQLICTIGGNLAFNAGGAHCLKYGMTSNHILGLKVVLPDGEVVQLGGESLEATGPDGVGLFVGSEGLFGIALEITLRLLPKPETFRTVLAAYRSLEAAGKAVSMVVASGLLPGAMEIMDNLAIEAAEAAVNAGYPRDAAGLLIVELDGESGVVEAEFSALMEVIQESDPYEVRVAQDEADRVRIWKGRKSAFSAVGRLSPDYIVQDGVVPRSRLGEALVEIQNLGKKYEIRVANVFHAGDGNLHPLILFDGRDPGALERAEKLAGEILNMCVRFGGSITGEHGIGMEKRDFLPAMFSEADIEVMRAIRLQIDPHELSNQGKMFPTGEAPVLTSHGPHPLETAGVISRE